MKPLHWMGSSLSEVRGFPEEVRQEIGYAIHLAQLGDKSASSFPMVGFGGASVLEVVVDSSGNTFRSVYTVRFKNAVYVLHAFQKKSKRGSATPQHDMDLIRARLKAAEQHYRSHYGQLTKREKRNDSRA